MHDDWKSLATNLKLEVEELRSKLDETTRELRAEQRERVDLKMQLKFANDKLRFGGSTCRPVSLEGGELAECGECCTELAEDYAYCPWCGRRIDWGDPIVGDAA